MAWIRRMTAQAVVDHREFVGQRPVTVPGYGRPGGEIPMRWGGRGAAALGLTGTVNDAEYDAIYRLGGAVHPATAERLVRSIRPRLEGP